MLRNKLAELLKAWLAEIRRADEAQDGRTYLALPVLEAIARGHMPPERD